jgi:hypothetical protein
MVFQQLIHILRADRRRGNSVGPTLLGGTGARHLSRLEASQVTVASSDTNEVTGRHLFSAKTKQITIVFGI